MNFKTFKVTHKLTLCSGLLAFLLVSSGNSFNLAYASSNTDSTASSNSADQVSPDNSKMNRMARSADEATADSQGMSKSDIQITRAIRQSLIKDSSLSTYAHNVKIITEDGKVTLKGPVRSEQEKSIIAQKAKKVAGPKNVQDQLEVATN